MTNSVVFQSVIKYNTFICKGLDKPSIIELNRKQNQTINHADVRSEISALEVSRTF